MNNVKARNLEMAFFAALLAWAFGPDFFRMCAGLTDLFFMVLR